jgi:hypothetical protein
MESVQPMASASFGVPAAMAVKGGGQRPAMGYCVQAFLGGLR